MFCGLCPSSLIAVKHKKIEIEDASCRDRELELLRECAGDHVMPLYSEIVEDMKAWLLMPYVEHTLCTFMQQQMCWKDVPHLVLQITRGLHGMHEKNVLHRDLKLENIMVSSVADHPQVYISDLGSASGGVRQWPCNTFVTTLEYAAPEIWENGLIPGRDRNMRQLYPLTDTYNVETDLWAASVIFLQLVLNTLWIPGVMEAGKSILPFVMYLGVLKLSKIGDLIIDELSRPVVSILRTGLQADPQLRRGLMDRGMAGVLPLALEWSGQSMLGSAPSSIARVLDTFSSRRNELGVRERGMDLCPHVFAPFPMMPGWRDATQRRKVPDGENVEVVVHPSAVDTSMHLSSEASNIDVDDLESGLRDQSELKRSPSQEPIT